MKGTFVSAAMLAAFAGLAMPGCVTAPSPQMKDSMGWVHQHKGEGARRTLVGTEEQLMEEAASILDLSYTVTREPHALFADYSEKKQLLSFAFYFHPSDSGRTEVEALVASKWYTAESAQAGHKRAIADFFPLANLNTRLLEPDFDPNMREASLLPLSTAAFYDSKAVARKLIERGANVAAALDELKTSVSVNKEFLDRPENKRTYRKASTGVALLESLKSGAKEAEGTGPPPAPAASKAAGGKGDIADRLRKLDDLKRQGLVTEEEYKRKKQELLDQL